MSEAKIIAILGVGPGLGAAVARRFAREGFTVALMARDAEKLATIQEQIVQQGGKALAIPTDATQPTSVASAFARVREQLGSPEVFVYNIEAFQMKSLLDLTPEEFEYGWKANCFGAFLGSQEVLPAMLNRSRGTILLTGATAALRGSARFVSLAVGKFGLRALAQSLAREFGPRGIHVAHVIVDGLIDMPTVRQMFPERETHTLLAPDAIAEVYWQLHSQPPTVWTLEMDLRPAVEKF